MYIYITEFGVDATTMWFLALLVPGCVIYSDSAITFDYLGTRLQEEKPMAQ